MNRHWRQQGILIVWVCLSLLLTSCGGGSIGLAGPGGVGSGGTGIMSGSVNGLASVILDGHELTDTLVSVNEATDQASLAQAPQSQLTLGDQLRITLNQGQIVTQQVQAQAAGVVQSVSGSVLMVQGMRVISNTNAQTGPVTFFTAVQNLSGIAVGDRVEVYGFYAIDATGPYLWATRIVEHASAQYHIWTAELTAMTSNSFSFGSQVVGISATVSGLSQIQVGMVISVWVDIQSSLVVQAIPLSMTGDATTVESSGQVYALNNQGFQLNGSTVQASGPVLTGVQSGSFVTVTGTLQQGQIVAQQISAMATATTSVRLAGSVTQYVSNSSMVVRGIIVNAANAQVQGVLSNGVFVQVQGTILGNQVVANTVQVLPPPPQSVLSEQCQIQHVMGVQLSCTNAQGSSVQVQWNGSPFVFSPQGAVSAASMAVGDTIEVDGLLQNNGSLNATSLRILNASVSSPADMGGSAATDIRGVVYGLNAQTGAFNVNNIVFNINNSLVSVTGLVNGKSVEIHFVPMTNQILSITLDQ